MLLEVSSNACTCQLVGLGLPHSPSKVPHQAQKKPLASVSPDRALFIDIIFPARFAGSVGPFVCPKPYPFVATRFIDSSEFASCLVVLTVPDHRSRLVTWDCSISGILTEGKEKPIL